MAPKRSRGAAKSAAPMNPVEFLQKVAGSLDLIARKDGAAIANLKAAVKTFYDQGWPLAVKLTEN